MLVAPAGSSSIVAGVTLTGGTAPTGGAALVEDTAQLHLYNSIVEGNTATSRGGAVEALGSIAVQGSLVTGNRVTAGSGGAIAVETNGEGILIASTLSGNTATATGGGIVSAGNITMTGSTIAGNSAGTGGGFFQESTTGATTSIWNSIINGAGTGGACGGSIAGIPRGTFSHNLSDDATCLYNTADEGTPNVTTPPLGALKNNGGPTDTRAIAAGSPAINGGDPNLCITGTDQRGATAVGTCDIGAFEFGGKPPDPQLPPPVPGKTVNVNRASGIVKIKLPGSDEFFTLRDAQQVPIGSTFDTAKGRVNLVAAANNTGKTQRAWFYEGVFKLAQTKGSKPLTTAASTGRQARPRRSRTASSPATRSGATVVKRSRRSPPTTTSPTTRRAASARHPVNPELLAPLANNGGPTDTPCAPREQPGGQRRHELPTRPTSVALVA